MSAAEKGKQKEGEQPRSEALPLSDEEPEQSAETDPTPVAQPVEPVPPREYTPKVPYPVPAKTSRKDQEETKCKKMLEDLTIKLPLVDAIQMIPSMRSLMKGLISCKVTGDSELLMVSKECTAVLQNKPIKKLDDPGKFFLSKTNKENCIRLFSMRYGFQRQSHALLCGKTTGLHKLQTDKNLAGVCRQISQVTSGYSGRPSCPSG